ncbi:ATP-binding protein [Streptomyces pinistramenti]|uniref:ATP-binding protein n=1 Tax=Streptomyces pinistramenti TaxID=2884812 RepID=UPI001D078192|nr:ATP-binding protein [Streptomyces pinistramenti]MCB5906736.1 ATP-binding protein [Streptomyces pinistramenti]
MHPRTAATGRTPVRVSAGARPHLLLAPSAPATAKLARDFVRATLRRTGLAPLLDTAVLLTSEAVTRSLLVPGSDGLLLRVLTCAHGVRISVHGEPGRTVPRPAAAVSPVWLSAADDRPTDLGPLLLGRLADAWGTTSSRDASPTTRLWFELHTH